MSSSCTRSQNGSNSGQGERLAPLPRRYRRDTQEEDLGAPIGDELELVQRFVQDGERDDGSDVQGVGVHVGPVLVQPQVEGVDHRACRVGVVGDTLLDRAGERRPQQRAIDAHLVHELEPGLGIEERIDARHRDLLPEPARLVAEARTAAGDVVARATGHRDLRERRVGNVVTDAIADGEFGSPVDLDVFDDAVVGRWEELRQRVAVLVEVVVAVEGRVRQLAMRDLDVLVLGHPPPPSSNITPCTLPDRSSPD
jgi:hypothetical protein